MFIFPFLLGIQTDPNKKSHFVFLNVGIEFITTTIYYYYYYFALWARMPGTAGQRL
jgi:hypothetical protein